MTRNYENETTVVSDYVAEAHKRQAEELAERYAKYKEHHKAMKRRHRREFIRDAICLIILATLIVIGASAAEPVSAAVVKYPAKTTDGYAIGDTEQSVSPDGIETITRTDRKKVSIKLVNVSTKKVSASQIPAKRISHEEKIVSKKMISAVSGISPLENGGTITSARLNTRETSLVYHTVYRSSGKAVRFTYRKVENVRYYKTVKKPASADTGKEAVEAEA